MFFHILSILCMKMAVIMYEYVQQNAHSFYWCFLRALKAFISVSSCGYSMLMLLMYKAFLMAKKEQWRFQTCSRDYLYHLKHTKWNDILSNVPNVYLGENLWKNFSRNQNTSTWMDTDWHLSSSASSDGPWYDGRQHNLRFNYGLKNGLHMLRPKITQTQQTGRRPFNSW